MKLISGFACALSLASLLTASASAWACSDGTDNCAGTDYSGRIFEQIGQRIADALAEKCKTAGQRPAPEACGFRTRLQSAIDSTPVVSVPLLTGVDGQPRVAGPGPSGTISLYADYFHDQRNTRDKQQSVLGVVAHEYFIKAGIELKDDYVRSSDLANLLNGQLAEILSGIDYRTEIEALIGDLGTWASKRPGGSGHVTSFNEPGFNADQDSCQARVQIERLDANEHGLTQLWLVPLNEIYAGHVSVTFLHRGCTGPDGRVDCARVTLRAKGGRSVIDAGWWHETMQRQTTPGSDIVTDRVMTDHLRSGKTSEITFELLATEGQAGKVRDGLLKLVRQCQSASVAGEEAVEGGTGPKRVPAGKDEPARSTGVDQIARPLD